MPGVAVTRRDRIPVYNKDRGTVQELSIPADIDFSTESAEVANVTRSGDEWDRGWSTDLMNVALNALQRCPIIRPSGQVEGGFQVYTKPGDTAFLDCHFQGEKGSERYEVKSTFRARCRPIMNTEIGGGLSGLLYGHRVERGQCGEVWDREELKLKPREGKPVAGYWPETTARYLCAVQEDDVRKHEEDMTDFAGCLTDFDDMVRFSARTIKVMQPRAKWSTEEDLRRAAEEEKELDRPGYLQTWLKYAEGDDEAFVKAFRRGFRIGGVFGG